jgi:nicotinamidase-related amidase
MSTELLVEPRHAALIIELMQNDACHADGVYARNGVSPAPIRAIVPAQVRVAEACRAAGVAVIATRLTILTDLAGETVGARPILAVRPFLEQSGLRDGTWGHQVIDELPRADYELRKWVYSSFYRTELAHVLEAWKIAHLIFMGIATEIAVETTYREAIVRNFEVTVLSDCVLTYDPRQQAASLLSMARLGRVVTSAELLAALPPAAPGTGARSFIG